MAVTSGSITSGTHNSTHFYLNWQQVSQSIANNTTTINWQLGIKASNTSYWYSNAVKVYDVYINGTKVSSGGTWSNKHLTSSNSYTIELLSGTATISHGTNGAKTFNANFTAWLYSSFNTSANGDFTLNTIPRYGTSNQSLSSKTETSITMNWSSDSTVDYIWYSTNGGSSWTGKDVTDGTSGSYTISGLSYYTTYSIKTRIRRKDSQLTTDSSALSVTTYDIPYCLPTSDFTIGDEVTLKFYNPLSRSISFSIIANGVELTDSDWKISGTSYTGISATSSTDRLYASIPNAQSGKYKVKTTWGSYSWTRDSNSTYKIKGTETPTFNNFTYKDTNTNVTNITGNNQILVKGLSNLQVTVSSANKMVAQKSATPKNYAISIDTLNTTVNYSTSDVISNIGTVTSSGSKRLNVRAYDSRNLSTLAYKDITVYDYTKPVINATITRLNNFENQTTMKVSGTYTRLNINGTDKNTVTSVKYRYREAGGTWSSWASLGTVASEGKFTCSDVILSLDNTKSFEFEIQAVDKLQTTTNSTTLDIGQAIFFISSNKKTCYINGQEILMYDVVDTW